MQTDKNRVVELTDYIRVVSYIEGYLSLNTYCLEVFGQRRQILYRYNSLNHALKNYKKADHYFKTIKARAEERGYFTRLKIKAYNHGETIYSNKN